MRPMTNLVPYPYEGWTAVPQKADTDRNEGYELPFTPNLQRYGSSPTV
jgi:hypothetical protein